MNKVLAEARNRLWMPAGIEQQDVDRLIGRLMGRDVDLGELFFQYQRQESWSLEDGIVKDGTFSVDQGVGVRAVVGEKTGFAYAEDIMLPSLTAATEAARSITRQGQDGRMPV
ncbi:MAG: PmbA/TldA family metallopeptidase, partial [Pseudomonadales bacterium]